MNSSANEAHSRKSTKSNFASACLDRIRGSFSARFLQVRPSPTPIPVLTVHGPVGAMVNSRAAKEVSQRIGEKPPATIFDDVLHAGPRSMRCKRKLLASFLVPLLSATLSAWSADLTSDELQSVLQQVSLKNTWFMYSTEDGRNHAYHFRKDGSLTDCSPSFSKTQQFGIGSNTKMMTALLVIQAVEEGRLKLEARVDEIARQIEGADRKAGRPVRPIEVHPDFRQITLKNLLTHHAGFPGVDTTDFAHPRKGGRDALMRKILRMGPVGYRQESRDAPFCFHYSNEGYAVLGEILERISDPPDTFANLLRKKLFVPLGIGQCRLISRKDALQQAGLPPSSKVETRELHPLITPAAAASCSLSDWMSFTRYIMNGMNGNPTSHAVLRKPESFEVLRETQENCYYGSGALMFSKKPSAAYHFGGNSIHSSFVWFELGPLEKGMGTSFIVVSTEPFHEVSTQFYLLAQLIQEKTSPAERPKQVSIPASSRAQASGQSL